VDMPRITITNSRIRWAGYVACIANERVFYVVNMKLEGKLRFERPSSILGHNSKIHLKKHEYVN
jgi:hypothetical protein